MIKQAIDAIRARAIESTLVALGTILPTWGIFAENHLVQYVSTIAPTTIVRIILSLVLLLAYLAAAYFWDKPKIVFLQNEGCWIDKKTEIRYCASCKAKTDQLVPMKKESTRWRCAVVECLSCHDIESKEKSTYA